MKPRVLLADDNEAMLSRASAILNRSCTVVGAVKDGRAAVDAASALHPDVIVLDISMPIMNGLEAAASLREAGSTAAVIFLTVHEEDDFMAEARMVGGLGYVFKPRLAIDLVNAVQEVCAGRPFVSQRSR